MESQPTHEAALKAWRAGDRVTARRQLEAILQRNPKDAQVLSLLGRLSLEMKEPGAAIAYLDRFVAVEPRRPEIWLVLAQTVAQEQGAADAVKRLRAANAAIPNHVGIMTNLGIMLGEAGETQEARAILESVLKIDERSYLTHFNLARLLKELGEAAGACKHYMRAIGLKSDFIPAFHNLGNVQLDLDQLGDAIASFRMEAQLRLGLQASGEREGRLFRKTSAAKLRHDIEQFRYLRAEGVLDEAYDRTIAEYEGALAALPAPAAGETLVDIPRDWLARLKPTYNRLVHWEAGERIAGPALNPKLDCAAIVRQYRARAPGIAWFDGLLTPEALSGLRRFCLNSTIWNEARYSNGYLGAFLDRGFACPLLHQIASELGAALPEIFAGHPLAKMWAFKYDSRLSGIPIHADFAAVNVNFWITPDEANLNPDGGGLGVWDKEAPLDWDFTAYNKNAPAIRQFLKESGANMVNMPHRQNRAVMFNSDLFHETGTLNFKDGYQNRRINVTMLFGRRGSSSLLKNAEFCGSG
jgi:tetratricopeptide (TPR) repeat protein